MLLPVALTIRRYLATLKIRSPAKNLESIQTSTSVPLGENGTLVDVCIDSKFFAGERIFNVAKYRRIVRATGNNINRVRCGLLSNCDGQYLVRRRCRAVKTRDVVGRNSLDLSRAVAVSVRNYQASDIPRITSG